MSTFGISETCLAARTEQIWEDAITAGDITASKSDCDLGSSEVVDIKPLVSIT